MQLRDDEITQRQNLRWQRFQISELIENIIQPCIQIVSNISNSIRNSKIEKQYSRTQETTNKIMMGWGL